MDFERMKSAVTERTKAVMLVSINGRYPREMERFVDYCKEAGIHLIEDAAQSLGSFFHGTHLGRLGEIGSFSFSAPKIITTGQGGALITDSDELSERIRKIRDFGRLSGGSDHYLTKGWNFKFSDFQAVIGIEQMKKLPGRVVRKKAMGKLYEELLCGIPGVELIHKAVIEFDVQRVGGVSRTTRFWPGDEKRTEWGIDEDTMDLQLGNDELGFERILSRRPGRGRNARLMDDIYSWILSPEIREYLRGHHKPDRMERQALICMSHRGNTVRPPNALRRGGGRNGRLRNGRPGDAPDPREARPGGRGDVLRLPAAPEHDVRGEGPALADEAAIAPVLLRDVRHGSQPQALPGPLRGQQHPVPLR